MKLRLKILSGFIILTLMLTVAAVWSVLELKSVGVSVNELLHDNYKSIDAAKSMTDALEREDSGVLLLILGKWEEGRGIIQSADEQFRKEFEIAANNITIEGENEYIETIQKKYDAYKSNWIKPIVGTSKEGDINWYFENVHKSFLDVKHSVTQLMDLNDKTMYSTASSLRNKANRAIMPAVVAILSALIFSFMFNYFVNYYFVTPIVKITSGVKDFIEKRKPFAVQVKSKDELTELSASISTLCSLSQAGRNK